MTIMSQVSSTECGRLQPQDDECPQAHPPHRADYAEIEAGVVIALHDGGQKVLADFGNQDEGRDQARHGEDGCDDGGARGTGAAGTVFDERGGDEGQRKAGMPEHIEPSGSLRSRPEQAGRRKQARKAQRMHNRHRAAKEIARSEDEEGTGAQDGELREEKDRGDEVADCKSQLVGRNEGPDLRQRQAGERSEGREDESKSEARGHGQPTLVRSGRYRRQKDLSLRNPHRV